VYQYQANGGYFCANNNATPLKEGGGGGGDSDAIDKGVIAKQLEGLSDSEGSEEMEGSMEGLDESSSDYKGHSEVYFNGQSFEGGGDKGNKAAAAAAAGNGSKRTLPGNLGYPLFFVDLGSIRLRAGLSVYSVDNT